MNALALFWVTDSVSERSAGAPSAVNATTDQPVYEMSSERISSKGPGTSIEDMTPVTHRQSRQSWFDRGVRMLFSREPELHHETGTIDVEVSSQFDFFPVRLLRLKNTDRDPHRDERRHCFS